MRKKKEIIISLLVILFIVCSVFGEETERQRRLPEGQIAINFHENVPEEEIGKLLQRFQLRERQLDVPLPGGTRVFYIGRPSILRSRIFEHHSSTIRMEEIVLSTSVTWYTGRQSEAELNAQRNNRTYGEITIRFHDHVSEYEIEYFLNVKLAQYEIREQNPESAVRLRELRQENGLSWLSTERFYNFNEEIISGEYLWEIIINDEIVDNARLNILLQSWSVRSQPYFPSDPHWLSQWNLHRGRGGIDAAHAWSLPILSNTPGSTIVVAVIDRGHLLMIDLLDNRWINTGEQAPTWFNNIPHFEKYDHDGNGYYNDYFGWNAVVNSGDMIAELDFYSEDNHGTHVTGLINFRSNDIDLTGLGLHYPDIRHFPIDASSLLNKYEANAEAYLRGFRYVLDEKRRYINSNGLVGTNYKIINCSNGIIFDPNNNHHVSLKSRLTALIDSLGTFGVLTVAAAGQCNSMAVPGINIDNTPIFPGSINSDFIITVTGTVSLGNDRVWWQNYGPQSVHVAAPGDNIPSRRRRRSILEPVQDVWIGGTSMATPHVSGTLALMFKAAKNPEFLADYVGDREQLARDIRGWLFESVDVIPSLEPYVYTSGRINAYNALRRMQGERVINITE